MICNIFPSVGANKFNDVCIAGRIQSEFDLKLDI